MLQGQTVVLLIDDDGMFLEELQDALISSGYVAVTVRDARMAVEAAREIRPDVIFVDYRLGKADGLSVARGLREDAKTSGIPTVLMSGYLGHGELETDPRSGSVNAFLQKPFTQREAVVMIETVLLDKREAERREYMGRIGGRNDGPAAMMARVAIELDYPQEGETVRTGAGYTFRISAQPEAAGVEVCIDKGPWQACRQDGGYWWYDWSGFPAGKHQVRVRAHTPDGSLKMTLLRKFQAAD